jgi:putative transposase
VGLATSRQGGPPGGLRGNDKRVQRLWRDEGLKVPYRKRKKPHRGIGTAVGAMSPIAPNALWALDFQFDTTADGRTLKLLNVIDEYTRECPAIVVGRSIDADRVVATLDRLMLTRGAPAHVRFDIHSQCRLDRPAVVQLAA